MDSVASCQPAHPYSVTMNKSSTLLWLVKKNNINLSVDSAALWRSDCADVQAKLALHCPYMVTNDAYGRLSKYHPCESGRG